MISVRKNYKMHIQLIGAGIFLLGLFALIFAPLEINTYYSFTTGGKFHYEGFEFGSLMFAIITVQVVGYFAIALICIPLGYCHLTLQSWTRKMTLALLWGWLVLGSPLSIVAFLLLITSKNLPPASLPFLGLIMVAIYPVFPLLLIKLYNSQGIQKTFHQHSEKTYWLKKMPLRILVSVCLMVFFIFALYMPLLFNGIFPFFGKFHTGLQGVYIIDFAIIILALLTWGVITKKIWAWWGSILYFLLMTISSTMTFLRNSPDTIFSFQKFAPMEQDIVKNVPIQSVHFLLFFTTPLVITLIILIISKPHFTRKPSP